MGQGNVWVTKFEAYVIMIMMFSIGSCYRLFCVLFFSLSEACYRPYFCLCGLLTDSIVIAVYYTIDICMRFTLFGRSVTCVVRMTRRIGRVVPRVEGDQRRQTF